MDRVKSHNIPNLLVGRISAVIHRSLDLARPVPVWLLLGLGLLLWGGEMGRRGLWEPDEARFAQVSREMQVGQHWLVPFRQGEYYAHKPPLIFWLTNLGTVLTGGEIGRVAPRLPSLLGALLALWATSRLAGRWFSPRVGWLAVLLLCTSYLFWSKGAFGQIDSLLCGLEMMALYFLYSSHDSPRGWRVPMAHIFLGLGLLAKGPVGYLVPLGAYVTGALWAGERALVRWRALVVGGLIALAFPALWLGLVWLQGAPAGYFEELIFKQNIGRALGAFDHVQPFYYFGPYLLLDFLPWTLVFPLSYRALRAVPGSVGARSRLVGWMLFVILFFSLSSSKRNLYVLLVYPAAAILVAAGAGAWWRMSERWCRRSAGVLALFFVLLGLALVGVGFAPSVPVSLGVLIPAGLAAWVAAITLWGSARADAASPRWLGAAALSLLVVLAWIGAFVMPEFNEFKGPDEIVAPARAQLAEDEFMILYKMNGEIQSLYANRLGRIAHTPDELRALLALQPRHFIVAAAIYERELRDLLGADLQPIPYRMGRKKLIWIRVPAHGAAGLTRHYLD